jgi:sulfur carrier protein
MKAMVNGKTIELEEGMSLSKLVLSYMLRPDVVIIELNEGVVPRGKWGETILGEGDRIELVSLVGGG